MSFYSHYQGQCLGRVLHFLYHYCGLSVAEHAQVGMPFTGETPKPDHYGIFLHDKLFALYQWQDGDVPVFEFLDDPDGWFTKNQERLRQEAIEDGKPL